MLEDLDITTCVVEVSEEMTLTQVTLELPSASSASKLTTGSTILGEGLGCVIQLPDGSTEPWDHALKERIIHHTTTGATTVVLGVRPAGLHDVFEHGQLEVYHGKPHELHGARTRRITSLAANSLDDERSYNFASTQDVLSEAYSWKASRRRLSTAVQLDPNTKNCNQATPDGSFDDTECAWMMHDGDTDAGWALKAGNRYKLEWSGFDEEVSVKLLRKRSIGGAPLPVPKECFTLTASTTQNSLEFVMPDIYGQWESVKNRQPTDHGFHPDECEEPDDLAADGFGTRFVFRVESTNCGFFGCDNEDSEAITLLQKEDASHTVSLLDDSTEFEISGLSLRTETSVELQADTHLLIRLEMQNALDLANGRPIKEFWGWADLTTTSEFTATLESQFSHAGDATFPALNNLCLRPICLGISLAGMSASLGLHADLALRAGLDMNAVATVGPFRRAAESTGSISLHVYDNIRLAGAGGAASFGSPRLLESRSLDVNGVDVDIEGHALLGIEPGFKLGLFAGHPSVLDVHAYVQATYGVYLSTNFKFRTRLGGSGERTFAATDSFTSTLGLDVDGSGVITGTNFNSPPVSKTCAESLANECSDACGQTHDFSLDFWLTGR